MTRTHSSENQQTSPVHSRVATGARLILGLIFTIFGLNGFLSFLPAPPPEGVALQFFSGLAATGYFFPLLKGTEVLVGLALLSGRYVPLALTVLAPITLNIFAFHAFVDGQVALPLGILALQVYLAWHYRAAYRGVLEAKPASSASEQETHARRASYAQ